MTDDEKPAFDPTAPFEVVADKPPFDPSQPFEVVEAEGPIKSNVRAAAHGVIPAAGGAAGIGAGAAIGTLAGPVGTVVGGIVGGIAGSFAGGVAQDKLQENIPAIDDRAQMQADREAYPISTTVSEMLPFAGNPGKIAGSLAQRGASAAMMGGMDAAQQAYQTGDVDLKQSGAAALFGAAFPHGNKVTQAVSDKVGAAVGKVVPGRPGRTANPEADQAHTDVGDQDDVDLKDTAFAQAPPGPTGETTGNPQSAPERSARTYPKQRPLGMPEKNYVPTTGDMDPATSAALAETSAKPSDLSDAPAPAAPEPVSDLQPPEPSGPQVPEPVSAAPEPAVETGFPEAGQPVATGENEATPLPPEMPAMAKAAIEKSKAAQAAPSMPELKGETPINDSITDAQKAAGNYPKARANDFGKPVRVETHAGDTRRSPANHPEPWEVESPYDYGYFGKTMGPDGDPIDFARPKAGSPEVGDKHFIIDQKDATTGKYDEPKVFTYYKDQAAAVDAYLKGFSDGKGPARLHDITEVTRPQLVKFLAKHSTKAPTEPYGEPMPKAPKSVKERAVVQDAVAKLRAKGDNEGAEKLLSAPDELLAKEIEGKRTRKYGVGTGNSAGYPVEGLVTDEGKPVTANTKAKATERAAAHKAVVNWFEKSAPPKGEESNGALLDRIKSHPYPMEKGAWKPAFKPKEWMLAQAAKNTLAKPTPANIKAYRDAERLLRSGNEDAVANYRSGNRIEADIAKGKRSGDDAIAGAEAQRATENGLNSEEDKMIEALDAKRAHAELDVPHAKPTPVKTRADLKKTVDVSKSVFGAEPLSAAAKRKAEAAALAGRQGKAAPAESEGAASTLKPTKPVSAEQAKEYLATLDKAMKKHIGLDALPAGPKRAQEGVRDLFGGFVSDEKGAMDLAAIKRSYNDAISYLRLARTEPKSYRAMSLKTPHDEYIQSLSEDLHKAHNEDANHFIGLMQELAKAPKELDDAALERIYHARDHDSAHVDLPGKLPGKTNIESLPADLKALYDQYLKRGFDETKQFADNIRKIDEKKIGPDVEHHISRINASDTPKYNLLKDSDDPTSPAYSGLSVNADAAKDRKFFALARNSDGKRFVIEPTDKGFKNWTNQKYTHIKDPDFKFEDGKAYQKDFTMRQATTKEIMQHVRDGNGKPMKYFTNAGFSMAVAHTQLGSMAHHMSALEAIKQSDQFKKLSTTNENSKKVTELGYKTTNLPNFKGYYLHPEVARVLDQVAGHPQNWYRKLNTAITKLMFFLPTIHIGNVGGHWFVGRGWDNLSIPKNIRLATQIAPKAIKSVITQDPYQFEMRSNGAGTVYGNILTKDKMGQIAKHFKLQMEREPSKWGPIADKIGVGTEALTNAVYHNFSSKLMWAANDVFHTMRVMELQQKGLSMRQAIIETERDFPNYRMPHQVGVRGEKGMDIADVLSDPAKLSFGRYHYGMFNSFANIAKDLLSKQATMGDRVDAAGKLVAMAILATVVYPAWDKATKKITGNDAATAQRRGPISIPSHLAGALNGTEDIASAARSTFTVPPLLSTGLETLANHDFRGKPIVEPGDMRKAAQGDLKAAGAAVLQEGEHAARGLVSPLSAVENAYKKGQNPAEAIRDQALDIKNPSAAAQRYERMAPIKTYRDSQTRIRKGGSGFLEEGYNKLTGR